MNKSISHFFYVVLITLLIIGQSCSESENKKGPATELLNRRPVDIICEIRKDFIKVPRPVFNKIIFYGPWKETVFADSTYRRDRSYSIVLTREATEFLQKYSPLEIEIALSPLIINNKYGVDVLALFDGMKPRGRKKAIERYPFYLMGKYRNTPATKKYLKAYFSNILKLTNERHHNYVKARIDSITWGFTDRLSALPRYAYSYNYLKNVEFQSDQNTLDAAIRSILEEHSEVKKKLSSQTPNYMEDKGWAARTDLGLSYSTPKIDKLKEMDPVIPIIGPELKKFISHHDRKLLAIVLLSNKDIYTLGVTLGLHKKYWLYYSKDWYAITRSDREGGRLYEQNFKTDVVNTLVNFCNTDN